MTKKVYLLKNSFGSFHELLENALILYSVVNSLNNPGNYLRPRLANVLASYVLHGYSNETKKLILESKKDFKKTHLNQINSELQRKRYLHRHKYNENIRVVDKSLTDLMDYLKNNEKANPLLVIKFSKNL